MPSLVSCTLQRSQPATTWDFLNRGTYTLNYDIVTDGIIGHRALRTLAESGSPHPFPSYGATYSYEGDTDSGAYAFQRTIEPVGMEQKRYVATAVFSPLPDDNDVTIFEPDPLLRGPIAWFDREPYNRFILKDITGKPVANKCGRPYDLPPEKQLHRGVLVVEFNVGTLAEVGILMAAYQDAVNASPWTIIGWPVPARTALCQDVSSGPPIKESVFTYYRVGMRIAFNHETWDEPIIERGLQCFNKGADGNLVVDGKRDKVAGFDSGGGWQPGNSSPEPFNLAEDGTKLADGLEAVTTKWRLLKEANFNALSFTG